MTYESCKRVDVWYRLQIRIATYYLALVGLVHICEQNAAEHVTRYGSMIPYGYFGLY